jgi:hypothetical protein
MKNRLFIKAWTIVILLFSVILFMNSSTNNHIVNHANAALSGSKVQLKINEWAVTCTGWLGILNMWAVNAQFATNIMSWTYAVSGWNCIDTKWTWAWAFTIRITGDLYGWYWNSTISSWNAAICLVSGPTLMQWTTYALTTTIPTCATTTWMVITQDLLRRAGADGPIFQYTVRPKIQVTVPQNQAPGTYTWVLEVSIP